MSLRRGAAVSSPTWRALEEEEAEDLEAELLEERASTAELLAEKRQLLEQLEQKDAVIAELVKRNGQLERAQQALAGFLSGVIHEDMQRVRRTLSAAPEDLVLDGIDQLLDLEFDSTKSTLNSALQCLQRIAAPATPSMLHMLDDGQDAQCPME